MVSKDSLSFQSKCETSNPCSTPPPKDTANTPDLGHNLELPVWQGWACSELALITRKMNNKELSLVPLAFLEPWVTSPPGNLHSSAGLSEVLLGRNDLQPKWERVCCVPRKRM